MLCDVPVTSENDAIEAVVANVPLGGNIRFVGAVKVNVAANVPASVNASAVVKLPPREIGYRILSPLFVAMIAFPYTIINPADCGDPKETNNVLAVTHTKIKLSH